jgi:hypothetical protein
MRRYKGKARRMRRGTYTTTIRATMMAGCKNSYGFYPIPRDRSCFSLFVMADANTTFHSTYKSSDEYSFENVALELH